MSQIFSFPDDMRNPFIWDWPEPATVYSPTPSWLSWWSPVRWWWSSVWPQQHPSPTAFPQVNPSDPALITLTFSVSHFQSVAVKRRIGFYSAVIPRCSEVVTIPVCRWPGAGPLTPALPSGETSNNVNKILICFSSITKTGTGTVTIRQDAGILFNKIKAILCSANHSNQ